VIIAFLCALFALFGGAAGSLELHPMSRSSSRVDVEDELLRWTLRVQTLSLHEVLPALDLDGDGVLQRSECDSGNSTLGAYLSAHYQLRLTEVNEGHLLGECVYVGAPRDSKLSASDDWLEATWEFPLDQELLGLGISMTLFEKTGPNHVDVFELRRKGRLSYTALFNASNPGAWILFSSDDVMGLWQWIAMGASHILSGFDHLAFLAALLVCVRGPKQLALVITAFTLSHSLTLGLAALDLFRLPARFVELVIALSISFVALGGFAKEPRRGLWLEAMIFGLVHGLGFASFLGEALIMEERRVGALIGFNLGVEIGQLVFLLPIAVVLAIARGRSSAQSEWWMPPLGRRVVASVTACAGVFWFVERAGWIT
jgi:hypothetical protein